MSPKPNLTTEPAWQKLQQFYNENGSKLNIKNLFEQDPARFEKYRYKHKFYTKCYYKAKFYFLIKKMTLVQLFILVIANR